MTLIVGIICEDGVVMAADSASTDMTAQVKQPTDDKLRHLGDHRIVIGGSGNVGLMQSIREELASFTGTANTTKNVRRDLKALIIPCQRRAITDHVPLQMPGMNQPPTACLLAGGYAGQTPFLIEFEANGEDTSYDRSLGNFCAIGSGKSYAHALFRTHLNRPRNIRLGEILAYRVVSDSIDLAHFGLAHPVHMWRITANSTACLDEQAKQALADTIQVWRELETETIGRLLAPATAPATEIPNPEDGAQP